MKKLFKVFLTVCAVTALMCVFAVTASAAAASGTTGSVTWSLNDDKNTLTISGTGAMADYTDEANAPWYSYKSTITTVTIREGVTSVSQYGFFGYTNIASVSLPSTVKKIGAYAFSKNTSLTTITIPANVTQIGYSAFNGCTKLSSVYYDAVNCETMDGADTKPIFGSTCSSLVNIYIDQNVKYIPDYLFLYVQSLTAIEIPDNVRKIGESAFYNCTSLKTVEISSASKLYYIGDKAFKKCSALETFALPSLVTTISKEAFQSCTALTSLDISYHVIQIGEDAFADSGITVNTTTDAYAAKYCEIYGVPYVATEASYGDIGSSTPSVEVMVNTDTALSVLNGKLVIYVDFDKALTNECVHMAFYNSDNRVVDYIIIPIIKETESIYTVTNDISSAAYAKVFVWDSLETLMPISPFEKVEITRP